MDTQEIISVHSEIIECPECNTNQSAIVEHTMPWWTYIHTCKKCGYLIMESEWNKVPIDEIEKSLIESLNTNTQTQNK